jgi:hypothetical protein
MDINTICNDRVRIDNAKNVDWIELWHDGNLFSIKKDDFSKYIKFLQEAERIFGLQPKQPTTVDVKKWFEQQPIPGSGGVSPYKPYTTSWNGDRQNGY